MGPTWPLVARAASWIFVGAMGILATVALVAGSVRAAPTPLVEEGRSVTAAGTAQVPSTPPPADYGQGVLTGIASWYGEGSGVATQWCTWTLRHTAGCGALAIHSHLTGITVTAPVVDWCECFRGTSSQRVVDLQLGVVRALGLDPAAGLYLVDTWPVTGPIPDTAAAR